MNLVLQLRNNKKLVTSFSIFVFLFSLLAVSLLIGRIFIDDNPLERFLVTIFYFTTQSNFLIFIIMSLFLLKKNNNRWYPILCFIGLIDITITGLIFHIFLSSYMSSIGLMQQLLHTVIPIIYILFYFVVFNEKIKIKYFWISLIHPMIFIISVYAWIHPFFSHVFITVIPDISGSSYVYPILDPANYTYGIWGLILFIFGLLTPFLILVTLGMIYLKSKIEQKVTKN